MGSSTRTQSLLGSSTTVARGVPSTTRRRLLRQVLDACRESGDAVSPWSQVEGMGDHFADEADVVAELHREWMRVLVGRLHRGEIVARRTPGEVRDLYDEAAADHPTLRALLDAHRSEPALWEPTDHEHAMLARIAGLVPDGTSLELAAASGQALVRQRVPAQRSTRP